MPTIRFKANREKCINCGMCAADCPAGIIAMTDDGPRVPLEKESLCYKCEHCLAVCPKGAASIIGLDPAESSLIAGAFPSAEQMEALIKGRRTVRRYKDEDLDPALIQHLLEVAWHAPTGKNDRKVHFTLIDDRSVMAKFRSQVHEGIQQLADAGKLPLGMERFAEFPKVWAAKKIDIIFRGAPHLLIASVPKNSPTPQADGFIALSYFELLAQAQGIGTVWAGLFKWTLELLPELSKTLNIPDDHLIVYAMAFGRPAVKYTRTVQHDNAPIVRMS